MKAYHRYCWSSKSDFLLQTRFKKNLLLSNTKQSLDYLDTLLSLNGAILFNCLPPSVLLKSFY